MLQFHAECADAWLLQSNTCPLDGLVIYNPLTWSRSGKQIGPKHGKIPPTCGQRSLTDIPQQELFVPGLGMHLGTTTRGLSSGPLVTRQKHSAAIGMHRLHIGIEHEERPGCSNSSADPHNIAGPSRSNARSVPQTDCHLTDPLRREMEKMRSSTKARGPAKQNVKRNVGASSPVGNERPEQSLLVGLSGLEIQVHSRDVTNPGRTRPQKRRCEPPPIPVTARARTPESPTGSTQEDSEE